MGTSLPPENNEPAPRRGAGAWFAALFALGLALNLLPLTAKYLPFTDLPGHMGQVGALVHAREPAARIDEYFRVAPHACPSQLYEAVVWALARVMPVPWASNLYVGLFCVLALPLSVLALLRAFGRDARLALLALPLAYHRCVWYGFINYAAALPMALFGLALVAAVLDRPLRLARGRVLALAALVPLAAFAHFFAALWLLALGAMLVALRRPPRRTVAALAAAALPGALFVGAWVLGKPVADDGSTGNAPVGLGRALLEDLGAIEPPWRTVPRFFGWTVGGLGNHVDEAVLVAFVASVAGYALWVRRHRPAAGARAAGDGASAPGPALSRVQLAVRRVRRLLAWERRGAVLLLIALAAYFLLPMELPHPGWWAVSVRFVVPAWVFALLALPAPTRRVPFALLAPAALAGVLYGPYLAYDFHRWFMGVEMAGFDAALDDIPPGQRVLALWPSFDDERHYAHFPLAHAIDYYTVRRGGYANPWLEGVPHDLWVTTRERPPAPGWGMAFAFSWPEHAPHFDYFLAKDPPPGLPPLPPLFTDAPPGAVAPVSVHGLWRLYRRTAE